MARFNGRKKKRLTIESELVRESVNDEVRFFPMKAKQVVLKGKTT